MAGMTIHDIAREAGVAKSTVSRVITGNGYVNADTRRKVEEVMKRHDYVPSSAARSLSKQESDAVGLIIPEVDNPFFAEILKGISQVVDEKDLTLILCNTGNDMKKDLKSLQVMIRQRVKGLIFTPAAAYGSERDLDTLNELLAKLHCPTVLLDRTIEECRSDGVFFDNFAGAFLGTEALIRSGHERIGTIAGDMRLSIGQARLEGYEQALKKHGIRKNPKHVVQGNFNAETTFERMNELIETGDMPTAFFISNNLSCTGFLKAVRAHGLRIPEDVAFIVFDKLQGQDTFGLDYSYIERDVENMGRKAIHMLLDRLDNPNLPPRREIIEPKLVLLGSERRIR